MRHIQMTVSRNGTQIFQGAFDFVDLGDLAEVVYAGMLAFQKAGPRLLKQAPLDPLSIDVREIGTSKHEI